MNPDDVRKYFEIPEVADEYAFAVDRVGLWNSEKIIIEKYLPKTAQILELGCGAARVGINLALLGYKNLSASDFSSKMVECAKAIADFKHVNLPLSVEDATDLSQRKSGFYDGVLFCFNGFMQIPLQSRRLLCAKEIFRVLKKGGYFIFTTHSRSAKRNEKYWENEKKLWQNANNNPKLDEYGDICYRSDYGELFIHSPIEDEVRNTLKDAGFGEVFSDWRSNIANENAAVREFSDDCRFWVFKK